MINQSKSISCMGDSLTHAYDMSIRLDQYWPAQLQKILRALGKGVICRNWGRSGDTTTKMITRFAPMTQFSIPEIGIIFGGVNDPGNSITQATTQANLQTMVETLKSSGCNKILIVSTQYQNFSSGGDTLLTPYASYVPVRAAQQAAATAEEVVYVDLYNFLRDRIVNGLDVQGSASWHYANGNQHFNVYGQGLVSQCLLATIQGQGWDSSLN